MFKLFFDSCQELVFPSFCLECGKRLPCRELPLLCADCLEEIAYIFSPRCDCCGQPFTAGQDHPCGLCLKKTFSFDKARASVYYREPVISLISSMKFNGNLTGLATMAHLARSSSAFKDLARPDLIFPVPLHGERLRERAFNQALLITRECFQAERKKIISDILVRHRATPRQTGLGGSERRKNLSRAFSVKKPEMIANKNILLVDDVFTTGSTVNECAKVLRRAGAKRIEVFTLARAI